MTKHRRQRPRATQSSPASPDVDQPGRVRRMTLRGLFIMSGSSAGQAVLQLLFLAILARAIAPAEFGLVTGALIAVNLTMVLAESGIGVAIVQRAELTRDHLRVGFTLSIALGVTCWAVLALLAPQIEDLLRLPGLTPLLRVVGLVFVLNSLTLSKFLLSRRLEFGKLASAELGSYAVGYGGVAITLAQLGYGPWAIVWGQVAQSALRIIIVTAMAPHPVGLSLARGPLRDLVGFGAGYTIGRLALWAATQMDNFVVGRYLGPAALGLYGRAYQLVQMPANLFGQVANEVLFPGMAAVQRQQETLRRVFRAATALLAVLALPCSVLAALTSRSLVLVVLGPDWLALQAAFDVIIFGLLFRTSSKLTDAMMKARGAVYRRAWRSIVFAGLVLIGALVGQREGLQGVAIGVLIALAINYVITNHLCLTLVGMRWSEFAAAHVPAMILAAVAGAVGFGTRELVAQADPPALVELLVVWGVAAIAMLATLRWARRLPPLRSLSELVVSVHSLLVGRPRQLFARLLGIGNAPRRERVAAPSEATTTSADGIIVPNDNDPRSDGTT